MLKLFKPRDETAQMVAAFAVADADMEAALDELEQVIADVPPVGRVEYELKRLDVKIEVLEAEKKSTEEQIAALQEELCGINKILKSDILKRRELMTDEAYSPQKDGAGCHAVAIEEKRKRGDKAFPAKVEAAA